MTIYPLFQSHEKVTLFDPHFSQEDIQGFLDLGFKVPTENRVSHIFDYFTPR